jgi:hypothetical protein
MKKANMPRTAEGLSDRHGPSAERKRCKAHASNSQYTFSGRQRDSLAPCCGLLAQKLHVAKTRRNLASS